jgi:hypothetical protein
LEKGDIDLGEVGMGNKTKLILALLVFLALTPSVFSSNTEARTMEQPAANLSQDDCCSTPPEAAVPGDAGYEPEEGEDKVSKYFFREPAQKPKDTYINIYKRDRTLELYGDEKLLGRFKIALGGKPVGDKNKEGDRRTPEGKYYICTRNEKSHYVLFMGISYPNAEDAKRGLLKGQIDEETFNWIKACEKLKTLPPWHTPLGGRVGIHGGGNSKDWTKGCIAMSNEDIKIIWKYSNYKTPVHIYP